MSTTDPFDKPPTGASPSDDVIDPSQGYQVPDEKDDPFRPIGSYDILEDGSMKLIPGSNTKAEAPGKLCAIEKKQGPSGPMLVFSYVVTEGAFAGREFDLYVSFSNKARFKLVETYKAHGLPLEGPWPKAQAIGTYVILKLQDEEYQGRFSAKLKGVVAHPKGVGYRGTAQAALS